MSVIIYRNFVKVSSGSDTLIPFVLDRVKNTIIQLKCLHEQVVARVETEEGLVLIPDEVIRRELIFKDDRFTTGRYQVRLNTNVIEREFFCTIIVEAESDLKMEVEVLPPTIRRNEPGVIEVRLYSEGNATPVEKAQISSGTLHFTYQGNGLYSSSFELQPGIEPSLIGIYAEGTFENYPFQRYEWGGLYLKTEDLLFKEPYSWTILEKTAKNDTASSVLLNFSVEVLKKGRYGIFATLTGLSNQWC